MVLNAKGIAVRNPDAKHLYRVELHYGRTRWTVDVPADEQREAYIVAENESAHGVWTGKIRQLH